MSQAAARVMIESSGGRIINIGSVFGRPAAKRCKRITPPKADCGADESPGCEWAKYGIPVNAIGPGFIKTEMTKSVQEALNCTGCLEIATPSRDRNS